MFRFGSGTEALRAKPPYQNVRAALTPLLGPPLLGPGGGRRVCSRRRGCLLCPVCKRLPQARSGLGLGSRRAQAQTLEDEDEDEDEDETMLDRDVIRRPGRTRHVFVHSRMGGRPAG